MKITEKEVDDVCKKLVKKGVAIFKGYKFVDGRVQASYEFDKKKLIEYQKTL